MAVATYNVRTLAAIKGKSGHGHAECVLAKARQLGCDFIGLQETIRSGKTEFPLQSTGFSLLSKRKRKAGNGCTELGWQSRNRRRKSVCTHQLIDERLMSMRFELTGDRAALT